MIEYSSKEVIRIDLLQMIFARKAKEVFDQETLDVLSELLDEIATCPMKQII